MRLLASSLSQRRTALVPFNRIGSFNHDPGAVRGIKVLIEGAETKTLGHLHQMVVRKSIRNPHSFGTPDVADRKFVPSSRDFPLSFVDGSDT
ncbi:hypothetical protein B7495_06155 [Cryobacterium sp. LW097]|nr:hypothetical protein B7495_06155 [Cryobacterium sp. LW097]